MIDLPDSRSSDVFESLRKEYPDHVPVYINRIQYLEQQLAKESQQQAEKKHAIYEEIIGLSTLALGKINQADLLKYLGEKHHDPAQEDNKKYLSYI